MVYVVRTKSNRELRTPNCKPRTPNFELGIRSESESGTRQSTNVTTYRKPRIYSTQQAICNMQHVTCDMRYAICDTWCYPLPAARLLLNEYYYMYAHYWVLGGAGSWEMGAGCWEITEPETETGGRKWRDGNARMESLRQMLDARSPWPEARSQMPGAGSQKV